MKTSEKTKSSKAQVEDIINFSTGFLAKTIEAGALEGVSFPYFGKFVVKIKQVQLLDELRVRPKSVLNEII